MAGIADYLPSGAKINQGLQTMAPLLLSMGQNMQAAPHQRDPQAMQRGLMSMMQMQKQRKEDAREQKLDEALFGGGPSVDAPQWSPEMAQNAIEGGPPPGAGGASGGLLAQMGMSPQQAGLLRALGPEQAAGILAQQMFTQQDRTEFERLTQGMDPQQAQQALMIRLGLEPDADTALRVGATQGQTFRRATPEEEQAYGGPGQIGPDGKFHPLKAGDGMTVYGPDGQPIMTTGDPGKVKPFTEGQSKDVVFSTRARGALEAFEPLAEHMADFSSRAANADPTGLIRSRVQSEEFQVAQNAGNEFLQAILRKDTGAAITEQEQDLYGKTYLPQPGDGPEVMAEKSRARRRAISAIEAGMSPAQMIAQERGLRAAGGEGDPMREQLQGLSNEDLMRMLGR